MKIVFMGTPDFSVPILQRLIDEHEVICVYTRAPAISGRGKKINKTPIHKLAEKYGIEVRTPKSFKEIQEQENFTALNADISVVAAYGLILPKAVIEAFSYGCINVHASLLPRWRGAAPIQRSIEAGDTESGVTIMKVVEALDAGDMYKKSTTPITAETTGGKLHDILSTSGAELLSEVLSQINTITPIPQNEKFVTYATKISKDEARIDFSQSADVLERKIRAFNPFPVMFFEYNGERFKVLRAKIVQDSAPAGTIIEGEKCLRIACGQQSLDITEIQRQGKRSMPIEELLKGYKFNIGKIGN